ncbi:MAG: iron-sulfur cluster assembly scaffold protein [Candidatus Pacearchaeota archaeon]|nr:iron-sulfur cluster assembly scaffold protein [Candidatus Pacearchaeota archaeon]
MENLYRERLIEIYSERKNFGELKDKTLEIIHKNNSCNDTIIFQFKIEGGKITDARFNGKLCFVSTISAEVLSEKIKGMNIADVKKLNKEDVDSLLGIEISPSRVGCELFPLEAIKKLDNEP